MWLISLRFAIPFVAVTAASVFTSAFSASASYGVKPIRNSTASKQPAAYHRLRILTGRNPNVRVDARRDGVPALRRALDQERNPRVPALFLLEFPFPGAML
jgi:hypothetical protein